MKKLIIPICLVLTLGACGNTQEPEILSDKVAPVGEETDTQSLSNTKTTNTPIEIPKDLISQRGPYGKISISVPSNWKAELCPMDDDKIIYGMYGLHLIPEKAEKGFIEIVYNESFGVCGTGLEEKSITLAGCNANMGTYDNSPIWSFISFKGDKEGIVVQPFDTEDWWTDYEQDLLNILDTIIFDKGDLEGGAYIFNEESEAQSIGVSLSLKNISATGATMVFSQYEGNAPEGELQFGEEFNLEKRNGDQWEEVPIPLEIDYGFNDIAHILPKGDTTECNLDWQWLYGSLDSGEYRLTKTVTDFVEAGNFKTYDLRAYFVWR